MNGPEHYVAATPTGIPIEDCTTCAHHHPITRPHCPSCGLAHLFPACPEETS